MATSSKRNDEFFALAMACKIILEGVNKAKSDHAFYPAPSEKSFIGQMRKKYFPSFTKKQLWTCGDGEIARFKRLHEPGWMHPAIHGPLGAQVALLQSLILPARDHDGLHKPKCKHSLGVFFI
jgi:hypothetical protein